MKVAIVGAGIAGLTAGRELAKAGHEVTVLEKSRGLGGRMATRYAGKESESKLDHGISYLEASTSEFETFLSELEEKKIIEPWEGPFYSYNEGKIIQTKPTRKRFIAPNGMNSVGRYLSRLVDVQVNTLVGGLTHIGENRGKKRSWIVNLTSSEAPNFDAVILAMPSRQSYAILNTTMDEVATLKMISKIDDVYYNPAFVMLAGYSGKQAPKWAELDCNHPDIETITVESSKRTKSNETLLVVKSTADFAERNSKKVDKEIVLEKMQDLLTEIVGGWAALPDWKQIHFWRYNSVINPLDAPFLEIMGNDAPLALVGDYFGNGNIEAAYISGLELGKYWVEKFEEVNSEE